MNYYNEIDRGAAEWLRELMKAGLIPGGFVDERSIADVRPEDLDGFTQCHFFAGIGGWSRALRLAGWPDDRPVWTGSCPCQPFSSAGKGLGEKDPRHLWPHLRRLIAQRRPAVVFGEQVASAAGRGWLGGVRADLEGLVYAFGAADLCAASAGAPHIRQRLWWVADAHGAQFQGQPSAGGKPILGPGEGTGGLAQPQGLGRGAGALLPEHHQAGDAWIGDRGHACGVADAQRDGGREYEPGRGAEGRAADGRAGGLADAARGGFGEHGRAQGQPGHVDQRQPVGGVADHGGAGLEGRDPREVGHERAPAERGGGAGGLGHAQGYDQRRPGQSGAFGGRNGQAGGSGAWSPVRVANHCRPGLEGRDQGAVGYERTPAKRSGCAGGFWDAFDILSCRDGKARRVEPGTFPLAHGIPGRVGLLRGYGNAIVPEVAAEFIQAYCETLTPN